MTHSLVTGGAGFIGSHLVRALLDQGDRVRVVDNFSTGTRENLAGLAGPLEVLEADVRDRTQMEWAVHGVDLVFHLAAFVSVPASMNDPQACFEINVQGTINLLEAARQAGVRHVILASSAAVYGENDHLPVQETQPPAPQSPYALSKLVDEQLGDLYSRMFGLPVTALRYFNVYGPRQSPESDYAAVIPIFVRSFLTGQPPTVFGDGQQGRDFVYVGDVVRANLAAASRPDSAGKVFNVCTGDEVTLLDLIRTLQSVLNGKVEPQFSAPRPGDIYRSYGDPTRTIRDLGFRPQTSLREGLVHTAEWMRG